MVMADILGDLNERFEQADTLGKMWLLSRNSPKIALALATSGVLGSAAGVADVVLFKLTGLDKLKDFPKALEAFDAGLTELVQIANAPAQAFVSFVIDNLLVIGIKYNPKHAKVTQPTLEPVIKAIYARIRPLYQGVKDGPDKVMAVCVRDASFDEAGFLQFATYAHSRKMNYDNKVDLRSPETVAASLKQMYVGAFLQFLEVNRLISYDVSVDDLDNIDPKLLEELID
jgi:hypothetical protein